MNRIPTIVLWYTGIGLLLLIVQLNLGYISVQSIAPDVLVIFTVFIALRHGQFVGVLTGFGIGLLFDIISSDITGTNALAKLLAGFVAGYFFNEQRVSLPEVSGNFRFILIVALAALVHNIIYYFFYVQPTDLTFVSFFLRSGVAASLYTTMLAVILMLASARKRE